MSGNNLPGSASSGGAQGDDFLVPPERDPSLMAQQVRASIVSNVLQKGGIGLGVGLALSFGLFKRRIGPTIFTTGFALGLATEQGNQAVREMNERIRLNAIESSKPKKHPELDFLNEERFKKL